MPVPKIEEGEEGEDVKPNVKGEVVVIDPGEKAREREREGGEVTVVEAKERADMEVRAGEWPWRGTVERLAVGLHS